MVQTPLKKDFATGNMRACMVHQWFRSAKGILPWILSKSVAEQTMPMGDNPFLVPFFQGQTISTLVGCISQFRSLTAITSKATQVE